MVNNSNCFATKSTCNSDYYLIIAMMSDSLMLLWVQVFLFANCGPRISAQCVSHSNGKLDFYFEKNDLYLIKKNDLESPLIFVLFLKSK